MTNRWKQKQCIVIGYSFVIVYDVSQELEVWTLRNFVVKYGQTYFGEGDRYRANWIIYETDTP